MRVQRGVLIVALSGIIAVLAFILLGVVSLSLTRTDAQKLQHLVNLAAIGALSAYVDTPDTMNHSDRAQAALQRAAQVLQNNSKLFGQDSTLGSSLGFEPSAVAGQSGSGGHLRFGRVFHEPPVGGDAPCAGSPARYPCVEFFPAPSQTLPAGASITAVSITVNTTPTDAYRALFGPFLGFAPMTLSASSISNVIPRCIAYAIDVSGSGLAETHIAAGTPSFNGPSDPNPGFIRDDDPNTWPAPGLFAYRQSIVTNCNCAAGTTPLQFFLSDPPRVECAYWCNMEPVRSSVSVQRHYRSDYLGGAAALPGSPIGIATKANGGPRFYPSTTGAYPVSTAANGEQLLVDRFFGGYQSYWGPQPLSTWYLAMHAGLRSIERVKSPADRAAFIAFAGDIVGMLPPPINPGFTFPVSGSDPIPPLWELNKWNTSNYDLLVQMTNIMGRGMFQGNGTPAIGYPQVEPNAIQRGWFPNFNWVWVDDAAGNNSLATDFRGEPLVFWSRTNPVRAIQFAIQSLRSCPDSAHKAIIFASDGIPSCRVTSNAPEDLPDIDKSVCLTQSGQNGYDNLFTPAKDQLLGSIRQELIESNISLTMLLSGEKADPHVLVRTVPSNPSRLIAPHEARQHNLCSGLLTGLDTPPWCTGGTFFDLTPECGPDCTGYPSGLEARQKYVYNRLGKPGYKFRLVNGIWGQLAIDTNGIVCPVMEMGPPECYEDPPPDTALPGVRVLKFTPACSGPAGGRMRYSYYELTKAEQSSACVLGAQGPSPFGLFEPDPDHAFEPIGIP